MVPSATEPSTGIPESKAHVNLSLLDGGSFIGDYAKVHAGVNEKRFRMYNWAFYIEHNGRHLLWDLGLEKDRECYTPWVNKYMLDICNHVGPSRSIVKQLGERGVSAGQVDSVLFSHAHWDHCRPIKNEFPNATAYFGPGTKKGCSPGHLADPNAQWHGRYFDPERATEKFGELTGPWVPFGPFEKAMDFFQDGSFWVIQAPGHMPGNLCAAASLASGEWVLLASDCCHSRDLLDGKYEIATFCVPGNDKASLHSDIPAAYDTMSKIRKLEKEHGFHVALAHDAGWMKEGKNTVLMSLLDEYMATAVKERIPKDEIP